MYVSPPCVLFGCLRHAHYYLYVLSVAHARLLEYIRYCSYERVAGYVIQFWGIIYYCKSAVLSWRAVIMHLNVLVSSAYIFLRFFYMTWLHNCCPLSPHCPTNITVYIGIDINPSPFIFSSLQFPVCTRHKMHSWCTWCPWISSISSSCTPSEELRAAGVSGFRIVLLSWKRERFFLLIRFGETLWWWYD